MTDYGVSTDLVHRVPLNAFSSDILALKAALKAFARKLQRNEGDVDDLIQETIARALANEDKFRAGTNLKSWLFTIMRNLFNTEYALRKLESVALYDDVGLDLPCMPTQDWAVYQAEAEQLINRMPADRRSALLLISAGISYDDAAQSLGCEVGTIKSRVSRARAALMTELGDIFTSRGSYVH